MPSPPSSTDLRVSARRGGGNAGSIAAGEVEWAGRRTVLDARSLDAVARARRRCVRAQLAFLGGVLRQSRQRLPRPRGHHSHVITGCTCAQRTRHDEQDAPPTRRGRDLFVCAGRAPHIAPPRGRRVGTIGTGANLRARRRRPAASTCAPLQKGACAAGTAGGERPGAASFGPVLQLYKTRERRSR